MAGKISAKRKSQEISEILIEAIRSGSYPVGSLLPTEHQLASLYGVGRHRISASLDRLVEMGMITRRPRLGTRVRSRFPTTALIEEGSTLEEWTRIGRDFYLELQSIKDVPCPEPIATDNSKKPWLEISGLRRSSADQAVIGCCVITVNPAYSGIRKDIKIPGTPNIYPLIEQRYGPVILKVRQEFRAVSIDQALSSQLMVEPGTLGLELTRYYIGAQGRIVEMVVNTHPADRFVYTMEIRRNPTLSPSGKQET